MIVYLLPLVVLMSCLVAYLGDYLGRTLGKRRLTVFGLRPKHTAILITILTGMVISTVTLSCVMMVDGDVRRALLQFPQIVADLKNAQLRALHARTQIQTEETHLYDTRQKERAEEKALQSAREHLRLANAEVKNSRDALQKLQGQQAKLEGDLASLTVVNKGLNSTNSHLGHRQQQLVHQIAGIKQQTAKLNQAIATAVHRQTAAETNLSEAVKRREQLKIEEAATSSELQSVHDRLDDEKVLLSRLTQQKRDLDDQNQALTLSNLQLQAQSGSLQYANTELAMQNRQAEEANAALALQNRQAQAQLKITTDSLDYLANTLASNTYDSTHNRTVFEPDQLIQQTVVDCGVPADAIRQSLVGLVAAAEKAAGAAGAAAPNDDEGPLKLFDRNHQDRSAGQIIDLLAARLAGQKGQAVVRVQALWRAFAGGQVYAGITAVPYRRVYERGETIATRELDGRVSERAIRNEVASFLTADVRPTAIARGMLPDADNQISADILDKLLAVSREVHQKGRPVQVQVVAAQDTYCSQPLDLVFRVQ